MEDPTRLFIESSGSRDRASKQNSEGQEIPTEIHRKTDPIKIPSSIMALLDSPPKGVKTPNKKITAAARKNLIIS